MNKLGVSAPFFNMVVRPFGIKLTPVSLRSP